MAKKKTNGIHAPQKCGGSFNCEWNEENLPYLICDKCGHKIEDWIKWHKEYKNLYLDEKAWDEPKNAVTVVLGYFVSKYEAHYKMDFHFSHTENGLFRGTEAVMVRRLLSTFNNSSKDVVAYIDWYFANKVTLQAKKLTSINPLTVPTVIGLFRHWQASQKKITRSTPISAKMTEWLQIHSPSVLQLTQLSDFGDLQQFLKFIKQNPSKQTDEIKLFVDELYKRKTINTNLEVQGLE